MAHSITSRNDKQNSRVVTFITNSVFNRTKRPWQTAKLPVRSQRDLRVPARLFLSFRPGTFLIGNFYPLVYNDYCLTRIKAPQKLLREDIRASEVFILPSDWRSELLLISGQHCMRWMKRNPRFPNVGN